jgi:hypothetical protein
MSAQSAQRECSSSEGVQEFGGCFVNLCVSLGGLCGKEIKAMPCFFLPQSTPCRRKGHRGNVVIARGCRSLEAALRTFVFPLAAFAVKISPFCLNQDFSTFISLFYNVFFHVLHFTKRHGLY